MRRNWIWKSKLLERVKVDEAAMHLSLMGAASIRPPARQQFAILQCELNKVFDWQYQPAPATPEYEVAFSSGYETLEMRRRRMFRTAKET